eukprot:scaffold12639_cov139-Skeletonema_marinoi.AAC.8
MKSSTHRHHFLDHKELASRFDWLLPGMLPARAHSLADLLAHPPQVTQKRYASETDTTIYTRKQAQKAFENDNNIIFTSLHAQGKASKRRTSHIHSRCTTFPNKSMNVAGPIRSRPLPLSADGKDTGTSVGSSSSNDVDMYLDVPSFELSLDEFEEYALARLKVSTTLLFCYEWLAQCNA